MRAGWLVGFVVATFAGSGAVAFLMPSALSPLFGVSDGSGAFLDCEDLVDGDRIDLKDDGVEGRREIRVEADTRVRAEARFEGSSSDTRREARVEFCGLVEFVDQDEDGRLGEGDAVVSSDLVRFGAIDHVVGAVHRFMTESVDGNITITVRIPDALPPPNASLVEWVIVADPECVAQATHFAVKVERDEPSSRDEFLSSPCGRRLDASGDETSSSPDPGMGAGLECEDSVRGLEFEFSLAGRFGDQEARWEGRGEANDRVRAEARLDLGGTGSRQARVELCGIFQFVDGNGDGRFDAADTIVSQRLISFKTLVHALDGGFHAFTTRSESGDLSVTIRAPGGFPQAGAPLLQWALEATLICAPGATHFAVMVEQDMPAAPDRLLSAECGRTLSATGDVA